MNRVIRNKNGKFSADELDEIKSLLNSGGVIAAPADTVYGLVSFAFSKRAYERLNYLKRNHKLPYVVNFPDLDHLYKYYGEVDLIRGRVLASLFPGPFTAILKTNQRVISGFGYDDSGFGIRIAGISALSVLTEELGHPLWATSANRAGEPAPTDYKNLDVQLTGETDLSIDGGETEYKDASTVLDLREFPYRIIRRGSLTEHAEAVMKHSMEGIKVLVVCTGNLCRSPFAEGLLKHILGDLASSGVQVISAGTHARRNEKASSPMIKIANEMGFNINGHRSQPLDEYLLNEADLILVNEPMHAEFIASTSPQNAGKTHLLGELAGFEEVPDPFNNNLEYYRNTAAIIEMCLEPWVTYLKSMIVLSGWEYRK